MTDRPFRIGVVGCGKIGAVRAAAAAAHPASRVIAVTDLAAVRAADVAQRTGAMVEPSAQALVARDDLDVVIVATTHDQLAPVSLAAVEAGKHVLVEKPMSVSASAAQAVLAAARRQHRLVKVGFNHRYHPAVRLAHHLAVTGSLGTLMFIRCRYGHGGRPGYEREWRMDPARSGGGELLDQGIHAVDLFRWFLGDLSDASGLTANWVWPSAVEDNAFALFRTPAGQIASLHASWTQWKNVFSFEAFGERGAAIVTGLGGSYGVEQLTVYQRRDAGGPPGEEHTEFPGADQSWAEEWADFISAAGGQPSASASGEDGLAALALIHAVYESARTQTVIRPDALRPEVAV